jgi:hypothetical protein
MCAVIPAPPLRTITMAVAFGALGTFMALRRHRRKDCLPDGAVDTRPLRFIWTLVAVLFAVISLLLFLIIPRFANGPAAPTMVEERSREFPGHYSGSYGAGGRAAFAVQDAERLHFVLFYGGEFATTSSNAGSNPTTRTWHDGGSIRLRTGRTFGFHRESSDPEMLRVNGLEYDLRKGTLLVLEDDGAARQIPSFPAPVTRDSLPDLAAESVQVDERRLAIGGWYNFYPKKGAKPLNEKTDPHGWKMAIFAGRVTALPDASSIEVTYPTDPEKHFAMIAARARDANADGNSNVKGTAFREWEASVKEWVTRRIERDELDRITPLDQPTK